MKTVDMSGNVKQWCWDWSGTYPGNSTDYRGPASGTRRTSRGGSWCDTANALQVGERDQGDPWDKYGNYGFRMAKTY